jgi:REP element-mobilizing transposase RayT
MVSSPAQKLKGRAARELFPSSPKRYWRRHLGAREYFRHSSPHATDEIIKNRLENQHGNAGLDNDEDFKIDLLSAAKAARPMTERRL